MGCIFVVGIFNLYSASHASTIQRTADLYKSQLLWFGLSIMVGVAVSFFQTKTFYRYSYALYFINILLLLFVLILGKKSMGAQRWLDLGPFHFQPSELMKITIVLALGRFFAKNYPDNEMGLKELFIPIVMTGIPALLIIVQPDLGTGMLLILVLAVLSFYRQLRWKSIILIGVVGAVLAGGMYKFALKDYQKKRILTFINPGADARGSGYNAIQSKIAIGSGQLYGKGFRKSSQASLNYLPENHTDFVFAIYNEEHGLIGSLFLMGLYLLLFYRFIWLASSVPRIYDGIVVIGLMSIFFWHTFINMSMVTGLMPIVGIPLPMMSYGGSSLLVFGICMGMATSFSNSRNFF